MTVDLFEDFKGVDRSAEMSVMDINTTLDNILLEADGHEAIAELNHVLSEMDQFDMRAQALSVGCEMIQAHGLNKETAKLMDIAVPGFIAGLKLDLENLDEDSQVVALEGVSATLRRWVDNIKKFLIGLLNKVKKFFGWAKQAASSQENALKHIKEELANISKLDSDKVKDTKVNAFEKVTMDKFVTALNAPLTDEKSMQSAFDHKSGAADAKEVFGIKYLQPSDRTDIDKVEPDTLGKYEFTTPEFNKVEKTLKDHGYDLPYAKSGVERCVKLTIKMSSGDHNIKELEHKKASIEKELAEMLRFGQQDQKAYEDKQKEVRQHTEQIKAMTRIHQRGVTAANDYISNMIAIARAVIKCEKE